MCISELEGDVRSRMTQVTEVESCAENVSKDFEMAHKKVEEDLEMARTEVTSHDSRIIELERRLKENEDRLLKAKRGT